MQTAASVTDSRRTDVGFQPTQLDKRTTFYTARKNGVSVTQASKLAGVHRDTGTRWEAEAKVKAAQLQERGGLVATKQEIAATLTSIGLHDPDVAPRDRVNAVATLSKVMGYDAPTVTRHEVVIGTYDQYLALIEQRERGALALTQTSTQPQLGPGEAPNRDAAAAKSDSPNISQEITKVPIK